jgi:hypothetical protein
MYVSECNASVAGTRHPRALLQKRGMTGHIKIERLVWITGSAASMRHRISRTRIDWFCCVDRARVRGVALP